MGLGTKIMIIMICIAFLFTYAPRQCGPLETSPCTGYGNSFGDVSNTTGSSSSSGAFYNNINVLLLGAGAFAIAGSVLFPNPYLMFGGIALFLLGFATIPYNILSSSSSLGLGASDPLVLFIGLIFGFLMVIAGRSCP